jgi:hypothetical protein
MYLSAGRFLRNFSPLMPEHRGATALADLACSRVRTGDAFQQLLAAASAHGVRLNAVLTTVGCFARAVLQAVGWDKTSFRYNTAFAVALRSAARCHPDGLHPLPTDFVFAPSSAHLSGSFDGTATFWELARRLQIETDEAMSRHHLADNKTITMALHPYLPRGVFPRGVPIVGDIDILNLGSWPYESAHFARASVTAYRLVQSTIPGSVTPGIMQLWLAALPSGAFTWNASYARAAFPSRASATAFLEAFVDLTLDLPLRAEETTVAGWLSSLGPDSPFVQYGQRYKELTDQ